MLILKLTNSPFGNCDKRVKGDTLLFICKYIDIGNNVLLRELINLRYIPAISAYLMYRMGQNNEMFTMILEFPMLYKLI